MRDTAGKETSGLFLALSHTGVGGWAAPWTLDLQQRGSHRNLLPRGGCGEERESGLARSSVLLPAHSS